MLIVVLFFLSIININAEGIVTNKDAQKEFKWALTSYNNGLYDDSLLSLKKILNFDPDNLEYHFWIGNVYYRLGYTEEALIEWRNLKKQSYKLAYINNLISTIEYRRGILSSYELDSKKLVKVINLDNSIYKRPNGYKITSIKADEYGGYYAVNFIGNEILHFDINNNIKSIINGGFSYLKSPYDIVEKNGLIYVTIYSLDEIWIYDKKLGINRGKIGSKGSEEGKLLAPQYMVFDDKNYLYITEWGNKRISKFDFKGNFISSFGKKTIGYMGLLGPTGITFLNGNIYVADSLRGTIEVFDTSGNHLHSIRTFIEEMEGISSDKAGNNILISSKNGVYKYNILNGIIDKLIQAEKINSKFSSSILDLNNQILVSDFNMGKIAIYKSDSSIYNGLFIEVRRIVRTGDSEVCVEVNVSDKKGNPVIGLTSNNFSVVNENYYILNPKIVYSVAKSNDMNISIVFDKSSRMKIYDKQQIMGINTLLEFNKNKYFHFISATSMPVIDNLESLIGSINKNNSLGFYEKNNLINMDVSLKLAGSELMSKGSRRAVIFFSDGFLNKDEFSRYSLDNILNYYKNNNIRFYLILFGEKSIDSRLQYLIDETGGEAISFSSYEGIAKVYDLILSQNTGTYILEYNHPIVQNPWGYFNLSVGVDFNQQTGRGEFTYFY